MSKSDLIAIFSQLASAGLNSINASVSIAVEEDCVVVRDFIVDFETEDEIRIFEGSNPDEALITMPSEAIVSSASFVCNKIAEGLITRAIESTEISKT